MRDATRHHGRPSRRRWTRLLGIIAGIVLPLAASVVAVPTAGAATGPMTTWVPTGDFASSSFERVPQQAATSPGAAPSVLRIPAVRNAPVSAQLAVTAHEDLDDLTVTLRQPPPEGTKPLPRDAVTVRYATYIPLEGTGEMIADPLLDGPVDVAAGTNQPIWFTIDVPQRLAAGTYGLQVDIRAAGADPVVHQLVVDVADVTLSDPEDYEFYLNLWLQPDAVAYAHDVPVYSERHWALLERYLADLASRGQKVINASIIEDPWEIGWPDGTWHAQTYYPFHSLVGWRYDGASWTFDYSRFDRYVEASRRAGLGPDIRVYALLLFGGRERLFYTDVRTGETVREVVQLGDARWREAWTAFLTDFEQHLRDRGWFADTRLAFDERPSATMRVVQDFLAESAPAFADKVHIAVHTMDVDHTIPDISYAIGLVPSLTDDMLRARREAGHVTTFYTTGGPWTPNTLTSSPPVGARLLPWIPAQRGLDGYLRWSYNSWSSDDVFRDPAYRYAQGDEYIVYPGEDGPVSSIRWEMFRDGVVDYELLRQLSRRAGEDNATYQRALAMVDAYAAPSAELYRSVVGARALVVEELERHRGVAVEIAADPGSVVAGERTQVTVTLTNDGPQPLVDVRTELDVPDGWELERLPGDERVAEHEKASSRFAVTVPANEPTATHTLTATLELRQGGEQRTLTATVPLKVQAGVGIVDVAIEPDHVGAGEPARITATVVNRGAAPATPSVEVAPPAGWTAGPAQELDLAPGAQRTVSFDVEPGTDAPSGRTEFTVAASLADRVVEQASTALIHNEVAVTGLRVHSVSSEEVTGEDGAAANLVDGDPLTIWHTRWFDRVDPPPHEVVLDLGARRSVHAIAYLPRQTGTMNGTIKDFAVYVGDDPDAWGKPVHTGRFANTRDRQRVDFPATEGRYLRLVALSEQSGQSFASGAELSVLASP